jgi:hypothetical protein
MKIGALLFLLSGLLSATLLGDSETKQKPASKDKPYTLDTCIVSDEKLGEMGDPFVTSYKGQQVKMCCKACNKDFTKNPDKYMKKLAAGSNTKK